MAVRVVQESRSGRIVQESGTAPIQAVKRGRSLDVPVVFARERSRELRLALKFRECAGVSVAEVEDILDSTITALLARPYGSEEHLFAALRKGVKMRALRLHRDRALHDRALASVAPVIYAEEQARAWRDDPEHALLSREDDLLISEFLAELSTKEREVFALHADGRSWRAIATALSLPETTARHLTRACERKRERFVTLYLSGRLCGSRSHTIAGLLAGELTDAQALDQALVHLSHCHVCRREHRTTSPQLRASFEHRALALLPLPPAALTASSRSWLARIQHALSRHGQTLQRILPTRGPGRAVEATVAGAGAGVKAAVAVVGVLTVAGTALSLRTGAHHTHAQYSSRPRQAQLAAPAPTRTSTVIASERARQRSSARNIRASSQRGTSAPFGPGQMISEHSPGPHRRVTNLSTQRGLASRSVTQSQASPSSTHVAVQPYTSTGGGPFTP